jgi:(p)ppGpp synthase/HD superfamily hydrolase
VISQEVYDARALRVVVDDGGGKRLADAVQCCYRLVAAVHKLWHPIHGEFDDYIANPKSSGYQALHTAVWGPGGAALEVQIKTSGGCRVGAQQAEGDDTGSRGWAVHWLVVLTLWLGSTWRWCLGCCMEWAGLQRHSTSKLM